MLRLPSVSCFALSMLAASCAANGGASSDAGVSRLDARPPADGAPLDTGPVVDASPQVDGGSLDASADAGAPVDASPGDAGAMADAGLADAGLADAGAADAGMCGATGAFCRADSDCGSRSMRCAFGLSRSGACIRRIGEDCSSSPCATRSRPHCADDGDGAICVTEEEKTCLCADTGATVFATMCR
ncbi:MAG: hypothetical protein RLO52_11940 [Sandaracinaceae bacterium]